MIMIIATIIMISGPFGNFIVPIMSAPGTWPSPA